MGVGAQIRAITSKSEAIHLVITTTKMRKGTYSKWQLSGVKMGHIWWVTFTGRGRENNLGWGREPPNHLGFRKLCWGWTHISLASAFLLLTLEHGKSLGWGGQPISQQSCFSAGPSSFFKSCLLSTCHHISRGSVCLCVCACALASLTPGQPCLHSSLRCHTH